MCHSFRRNRLEKLGFGGVCSIAVHWIADYRDELGDYNLDSSIRYVSMDYNNNTDTVLSIAVDR